VSSTQIYGQASVKFATDCYLFIAAQKYILCQYNVPREKLTMACDITPGKRAPTITALEHPGWVAVSSMVEKKMIATVMDKLTAVGRNGHPGAYHCELENGVNHR